MFKRITIIILLIFISVAVNAQTNVDSLNHELYKILDSQEFDSSSIKFVEYVFNENIEINPLRASEAAAIGIKMANKIGDTILIARMQNLRGISILKQKTYFMASQIFFENYRIFKNTGAEKDMANTLLLIAEVYLGQGIADISESKAFQALEIYQKINDSIGIGNTYMIIGHTYVGEDDYKAIEYFNKAKYIYETINDEYKKAEVYLQLSKSYLNIEKTDFSIDYLTKAIALFKKLDKKIDLAKTYSHMGDAFYYDQAYELALKHYRMAKTIYNDFNVTNKIIDVDLKLAKTYFELNDYNKAISTADSALNNSELFNDKLSKSNSYKILADCYSAKNQLNIAYKYSELYSKSLIEYYDEKSVGDFSLFQMNLETQNKENEFRVEKMQSEKEQLQLAQKQYNRNKVFAAIILLLVLVILFFLFYRMRERKKDSVSLQKTNLLLKQEIEERRKAELDSRTNEERYELLFSQTPVGILQFDENLLVTNVNERFAEIFHKSSDELHNKHLNSIFDRNTVHKIAHLFDSKDEYVKIRSEIPTRKEVVFVSATIKKYRLWIDDEEIVGGIIIIEDFTEHKRAERYYKANILLKQMLVKQIPDDIILLDGNENIIEIHFPDIPEKEIGVSKLSDLFKDHTLSIFRTHFINAKNSGKTSQFFFSDGAKNFLVRAIPSDENILLIITRFEGEAQDAGIIIKEETNNNKTSKDNYLNSIQNDIEKELLPIYQNIQRGLSFLMIKNFAEKIVTLGKNYNNNKITDYGEQLLDYVTSFNVFKVNETIEKFPSFISQFMGLSAKF